jgi:hypothetical protein
MTTTVPVLVSSNPIKSYWLRDVFGAAAFVLARSFEDAWQEACDWVVEHDGPCDHGGDATDEQIANGDAVCDCDQTDDGQYVWMVEYTMRDSALTAKQVFDTYGDDVETIEVRSEALR